ncbi:uncharacterized protein ASPGLDRAFT_1338720 [Aspergillus glaucus CBS 516.65]|uniref:Uncharacterized protein n=1 Tax=Aspergillus glaucus CBS 516.65 TaxID=1160497 RepID=A0A1L9VQS2_ASPGL|nr:hypothetical protein ASPGLDRAFT_1338720 [Aspergillus glaucus CBS 516.65]OJJ86257.1 hypothetical protein ASPGLDRAFT_1338720 [Aspergillus glaucus CBS 516.65]
MIMTGSRGRDRPYAYFNLASDWTSWFCRRMLCSIRFAWNPQVKPENASRMIVSQ